MSDWTGSERERKPQGLCLPPQKKSVNYPRFVVPHDVPCHIRRVTEDDSRWRPFRTRKATLYEKYEFYDRATKRYVFRLQGYCIRVHRSHVIHRADLIEGDRDRGW